MQDDYTGLFINAVTIEINSLRNRFARYFQPLAVSELSALTCEWVRPLLPYYRAGSDRLLCRLQNLLWSLAATASTISFIKRLEITLVK
jgi:hypothetical protein